MGNWRTVNMTGTCDPNEVPMLEAAVNTGRDWKKFHCLCYYGPSICGLGMWVGTEIHAVGNLAERDYSVEAVAEQLKELVKVAPSLTLKVHCGDDYESLVCVNTITVANGVVTVGEPQVERLQEIGETQMTVNLMKALYR